MSRITKRAFLVGQLLTLAVSALLSGSAVAQSVSFPDIELELAIREILGIPHGEIDVADMLTLTDPDFTENSSNKISDLTGLETASNLVSLDLAGHRIADLSPLSGLANLERLDLAFNEVVDLGPIAALPELADLNAISNRIVDPSPLASAPKLATLNLRDNLLTEAGGFSTIAPLQNLRIDDNFIVTDEGSPDRAEIDLLVAAGVATTFLPQREIADVLVPEAILRDRLLRAFGKDPDDEDATITTYELAQLYDFAISDHGVRDLTGLEHAIKLHSLDLFENDVADFTPINQLNRLRVLDIGCNPITDLSTLAPMRALRDLKIDRTRPKLTDISHFENLPKLERLNVWDNNIENIGVLSRLGTLTHLTLSWNPITNLWPLEDLTGMKALHVRDLRISEINVVARMTELEEIDISDTDITDLSVLEDHTTLKLVALDRCQIDDLSPIAGNPAMETVNASFTGICTIEPLRGMVEMRYLGLYGNRISDLSPLWGMDSLKLAGFGDNQITELSVFEDWPLTGEFRRFNFEGNFLELSGETQDIIDQMRADNLRVSVVDQRPRQMVHIPDTRLFGILQGSLPRPSLSAPAIDNYDLARITSLATGNHNHLDLRGLEHALNLEYLYLEESGITDITPLAPLTKLEWLSIKWNPITDLSAVANLKSLRELIADETDVTDFTPLAGLKKLEVLYVDDIDDLSPLADLVSLRELGASGPGLTDISVLARLPALRSWYSYGSPIADFSPLADMNQLTWLRLTDTDFDEFELLTGMTELEVLIVLGCGVTDISPLRTLTNLREVGVSHNAISDIGALLDLPLLNSTSFSRNFVDLTPGSDANGVIRELEARGVRVSSTPQRQPAVPPLDVAFDEGSNALTLSWPSERGVVYEVRFSEDFGSWTTDGQPFFFGTGEPIMATLNLPGSATGFFELGVRVGQSNE